MCVVLGSANVGKLRSARVTLHLSVYLRYLLGLESVPAPLFFIFFVAFVSIFSSLYFSPHPWSCLRIALLCVFIFYVSFFTMTMGKTS